MVRTRVSPGNHEYHREGVRCWVFSEVVRGNPLVERHSTSDQEEVERWVRDYDKLVVLVSAKSLEVEALLSDITQAKQLQLSTEKWSIFLAAADDALVEPRSRFARSLVAEHVVFDLRGKQSDPGTYKKEVERLAEALKQDQPASAGIPVSNLSVGPLCLLLSPLSIRGRRTIC